MTGDGFRSLSRAMFRGFVRDRTALAFSILLPVLFLLFFGTIYKNSSAPKISVITVGPVQLIQQARQADHGLAKVLSVTRDASLAAALVTVRHGNADAAVTQQFDFPLNGLRRVLPPGTSQFALHEGLHAQADPIDAAIAPCGDLPGVQRSRRGFDGCLKPGAARDCVQKLAQCLGFQRTWRAASQIQRLRAPW